MMKLLLLDAEYALRTEDFTETASADGYNDHLESIQGYI
jgi:hypothetical protein